MIKFLFGYSDCAIRKVFFKMEVLRSVNEVYVKCGHYWISTTSDAFRKCNCSGCGDVERLVSGVWVSVSQRRGKKKKCAKNATFVNLSLF
jgi:hypothetical protein